MKYSFIPGFFISFLCVLFLLSCTGNANTTTVDYNTLIVATENHIINFDLEKNVLKWEYNSPYDIDADGNRNIFTIDGQYIYQSFESGLLAALDINSGQELWSRLVNNDRQELSFGSDEQPYLEVFASQPLVKNGKMYIASILKHTTEKAPALYCFDSQMGSMEWSTLLSPNFNYYQPVMLQQYIFLNSAVWLLKFSPQGSNTSYGMYDENEFEAPLYCRMQADDSHLYPGDENGKFYCIEFDKYATVKGFNDIMNPENTFTGNPDVFKWMFNDTDYTFQKNKISFLRGQLLITEIHNSIGDESCFFAINKKTGKPAWKKVIEGDVMSWSLINKKIIGYNETFIFTIDLKGNLLSTIPFNESFSPVSNIEEDKNGNLLFATTQGIAQYSVKNETFTLLIPNVFNVNYYNNFQIKYFD